MTIFDLNFQNLQIGMTSFEKRQLKYKVKNNSIR